MSSLPSWGLNEMIDQKDEILKNQNPVFKFHGQSQLAMPYKPCKVDSIYHLCPNFVTRIMDSSIEALDTRLRRLEYILTGSTSTVDTTLKPSSQRTNIPNQLSSLNDRLAKLTNTNKSIKKLLQACNSPPHLPSPFNAR